MRVKQQVNWIAILFALVFGIFTGFYLTERFKPLPEGYVLVPQTTVDSLKIYVTLVDSLSNLPPDTVKVDTIVYRFKPVYIETEPTSDVDYDNDSITNYADSIVNDKIDVHIDFSTTGHLTSPIRWNYEPMLETITLTIEKNIPYAVIEEVEVPTYHTGHYLSAAIGGNDKMFTFGIDYDLVQKDRIYGLQYRRQGNVNVYGVKVGFNINTLFKK